MILPCSLKVRQPSTLQEWNHDHDDPWCYIWRLDTSQRASRSWAALGQPWRPWPHEPCASCLFWRVGWTRFSHNDPNPCGSAHLAPFGYVLRASWSFSLARLQLNHGLGLVLSWKQCRNQRNSKWLTTCHNKISRKKEVGKSVTFVYVYLSPKSFKTRRKYFRFLSLYIIKQLNKHD